MATATATEYSTMIAVFASYDQANQAIDNLRHAGYGYDHIRLVERGPNNFIENLKSLFASQVTAMATSANDWMRIGVPEQEAHHYQDELDSGRPIVLVKSVDDPERAFGILRQCGAYDLSTLAKDAKGSLWIINRLDKHDGATQSEPLASCASVGRMMPKA